MFDTTTPTFILGLIVGGVALLLYGVRLITEVIQRDAGHLLRRILMILTHRPLATFGVGILITLITQSSGAISSLLVGLVSAQLLSLPMAIITLFGSNVGSALAVQLLVFDITKYTFPIFSIATLCALLTYRTTKRSIGQACFGFGLIIVGLAALKAGSGTLAANHLTSAIFASLDQAPIVLVLIGIILAMVFASSVAGIGLVIVMTANGALPLSAALAILLGSNIGSTMTALLAAMGGSSIAGRRLALVHSGTKVILALILLCLLNPLTDLISMWHQPAATLVAMSHLGFNLLLAILFVPLARPLELLATRLLPEKAGAGQGVSALQYLNADAVKTPGIALGQAMREVLHMADVVDEMLHLSIRGFEQSGIDIPGRISLLDDQLDELNSGVKGYLTQLDEERMTEDQVRRQMAILYIITDLEAMGDIIDKQWMRLAKRKRREQITFSKEGWADLCEYHTQLVVAVEQAFGALAAQDVQLAREYGERKVEIGLLRIQMQMRHVRRLQSGISPSIESSAIHLDFLNATRSVLSHAATIARVVQEHLAVEVVTGPLEIGREQFAEPELMVLETPQVAIQM